MQNFDSQLSGISLTKILNFFGFRLQQQTSHYNAYAHAQRTERYYIFLDENENVAVFSQEEYAVLGKAELLFQVSRASTFQQAMDIKNQLSEFDALDQNSNLKIPTKVVAIVNHLAGLVEADPTMNPLLKTDQFKRKIFQTKDGRWKTPLFYYSAEQNTATRIVNYVTWDDRGGREYFNAQSYCLNASVYGPENRDMVITSDPRLWTQFPIDNFSPDYFHVLCHPDAPVEFFDLLVQIFDKYKFRKFVLPVPDNKADNQFFGRLFSFLLNYHYARFFFQIDYSGGEYDMKVYSHDVLEQNRELARIFADINFELQSLFMKGWEGEVEVDSVLEGVFSVSAEKIKSQSKVISLESVSGNPAIASKVWMLLLQKLKLENKIEIR